MNQDEEFDWQTASAAERVQPTRALHAILQNVSRKTGIHFDDLLAEAQDQPVSLTMDPHRNFRAGKIAWQRARAIHEWLAHNHFETAQEHTPELFQYPRRSEWDLFLETHAIKGRLRLKSLKQRFGLFERDEERDPADHTLRLSDRFCFELETDLDGTAVAFQCYDRMWHPIPLGTDLRKPAARVSPGTQCVPRDAQGTPIGLSENNNAGHHIIAVIVAEGTKIPFDRASLAKLDPQSRRFEVHILNVRVLA